MSADAESATGPDERGRSPAEAIAQARVRAPTRGNRRLEGLLEAVNADTELRAWWHMAQVTSERLEYIPASAHVIQDVRIKYGCPDEECRGTILLADLPEHAGPHRDLAHRSRPRHAQPERRRQFRVRTGRQFQRVR